MRRLLIAALALAAIGAAAAQNVKASDTTDSAVVIALARDATFQARIRLRFITAALAVTTEDPGAQSHAERLALAGAILQGAPDPLMLALVILANPSIRAGALADPQQPGGAILDNDIDFQVASVFTGLATARRWQ